MKTFPRGFCLLAVTALLVCTLSCDSGSSSTDGTGGTGVPAEVAEAAEGIFSMIKEFMIVEDPSEEEYPDGITVVADSTEKYTMTLTGFSPEEGVSVTGQLVLEQTNASPLTLHTSGTLSATGAETLTVNINVSATYAEGEGPPDDNPISMSGSFIYNGNSYDITNVMEAIEMLDDNEEEGEGEPETPDYNPLPASTFPPGPPMQFYCIGTREFSAGSPWAAPDTSIQLDFTEDRTGYELYEGADRIAEGLLNWDISDPAHPVLSLYTEEGTLFTGIVVYYYSETEIYGHITEEGWDFSYYNTDPVFSIDDIPEI